MKSLEQTRTGGGHWLHLYAVFVAASTLFLILAGAMVTSTGSGLAVPDWPLSYGMFFPPMVGGVFWEHGHRMVAGTVGLLTLILTVWIWVKEPRRWLRWLGVSATLAVIVQATLGGITVLWFLPHPVSIAHACLAQTFFCITVALALFTSRAWNEEPKATIVPARGVSFVRLAIWATAAAYLQLLLGALYRHAGWGLVLHLTGAALVLITSLWVCGAALRRHGDDRRILLPALLLGGLVLTQVCLGFSALILVIIEREAVQPSTWQIASRSAHVVVGASVLATSFYLALRSLRLFQPHGGDDSAPHAAAQVA